jgi:hypothetical protein
MTIIALVNGLLLESVTLPSKLTFLVVWNVNGSGTEVTKFAVGVEPAKEPPEAPAGVVASGGGWIWKVITAVSGELTATESAVEVLTVLLVTMLMVELLVVLDTTLTTLVPVSAVGTGSVSVEVLSVWDTGLEVDELSSIPAAIPNNGMILFFFF